MVKIRLKRMGAKKRPFYRLVVADSRSPRDGRFIEALGTYDPLPNPAKVEIDADKVKAWLGKGARPTDSARALLQQQGIIPRGPMIVYPPKAVPEVAATAEKPTAVAEVAETPVAESVEVVAAEADTTDATAEAETAEPVAETTEV